MRAGSDLRAAPYDLSTLGFDRVRIETVECKQTYAAAQRVFAERGAPLRARLIAACEGLTNAQTDGRPLRSRR